MWEPTTNRSVSIHIALMLKAENSCNVFDLGDGRYNSKYLVREERSIPEPDRVCGVRTPLFVDLNLLFAAVDYYATYLYCNVPFFAFLLASLPLLRSKVLGKLKGSSIRELLPLSLSPPPVAPRHLGNFHSYWQCLSACPAPKKPLHIGSRGNIHPGQNLTFWVIVCFTTDDDNFELMLLNLMIAPYYTKESPLWNAIALVTHLGKLFNNWCQRI